MRLDASASKVGHTHREVTESLAGTPLRAPRDTRAFENNHSVVRRRGDRLAGRAFVETWRRRGRWLLFRCHGVALHRLCDHSRVLLLRARMRETREHMVVLRPRAARLRVLGWLACLSAAVAIRRRGRASAGPRCSRRRSSARVRASSPSACAPTSDGSRRRRSRRPPPGSSRSRSSATSVRSLRRSRR